MSDNFINIMDRLKYLLKVHSDSALAEMLALSQSTFAERKKRNSIPYDKIISLCEKRGLSTDWLFYGEVRKAEGLPVLIEIAGGPSPEAPPGVAEERATFTFNIRSAIAEHNRAIIEKWLGQIKRIIEEGDYRKTSAVQSLLEVLDPEGKKKEE